MAQVEIKPAVAEDWAGGRGGDGFPRSGPERGTSPCTAACGHQVADSVRLRSQNASLWGKPPTPGLWAGGVCAPPPPWSLAEPRIASGPRSAGSTISPGPQQGKPFTCGAHLPASSTPGRSPVPS